MKKLLNSFTYAFAGLKSAWRSELNFRIECLTALAIIFLSFLLRISNLEWLVVLINIGIVLFAELINTAIEALCNRITTEFDKNIKIIKDISAAAVLITTLIAICCGLIIFIPKIIALLN